MYIHTIFSGLGLGLGVRVRVRVRFGLDVVPNMGSNTGSAPAVTASL